MKDKRKKYIPDVPIEKAVRDFVQKKVMASGKTVSDFAKTIKISKSTVYRVISGGQINHSKTSLKLLEKLGYEDSPRNDEGFQAD